MAAKLAANQPGERGTRENASAASSERVCLRNWHSETRTGFSRSSPGRARAILPDPARTRWRSTGSVLRHYTGLRIATKRPRRVWLPSLESPRYAAKCARAFYHPDEVLEVMQ